MGQASRDVHYLSCRFRNATLRVSILEIQTDRPFAIRRDTPAHACLRFGTHFGAEPAWFAGLHGIALQNLAADAVQRPDDSE